MQRELDPQVVEPKVAGKASETIIDLDRGEILSILRDVQDIPLPNPNPGPIEVVIEWFD